MRRDLCYYYDRPQKAVYDAFAQAANQRFGKDCRFDPLKTLTFGLNYSFKYNMNGGAVTAHFMPYQNGTAVNLRYSIAQLMGARYKAHANDLITFVNAILSANGQLVQLNVESFLAYEKSLGDAPAEPAAPQKIEPPKAPAQNQGICPDCNKPYSAGAKFCSGCGKKLASQRFCTKCGLPLPGGARFCTRCGSPQNN